jgi:hypothetical protein
LYVYTSSPSLTPDMSGLNKVFIFFVPIVGLCLVMSLFIKVRILRFAGTDRAVSTALQAMESDDEKSRDEEQGLDTCTQSHTTSR